MQYKYIVGKYKIYLYELQKQKTLERVETITVTVSYHKNNQMSI
jgi:hypothetical protein